MNELTDKQRRFCEEYVLDWNATQAAIRAGYSERTARSTGAENLTKPDIQHYIDECRNRTAELAGISALRIAREYEKLAFANMSDLKIDWSEVKEWDDLTDEQKAAISEIKTTVREIGREGETVVTDTKVEIKLHDKQKALEALRKMLGFDSPDRSELNVTGDFDVTLDLG